MLLQLLTSTEPSTGKSVGGRGQKGGVQNGVGREVKGTEQNWGRTKPRRGIVSGSSIVNVLNPFQATICFPGST